MRRSLLIPLLAFLPAFAWAKPAPVLYVCAHPDDCLLFMNPDLYNDTTNPAKKVVVVYLTSGDAGLPFSKTNKAAPYPYARELASIDSSEWMADVGKEHITAKQKTDVVTLHGHPVERVSYSNTVSYFLRLPDGNFDGNGFAHYKFQSLRKLKSGESVANPVDGKPVYRNWEDLKTVLSDIVTRETQGDQNVTLHISEPDTTHNYNDHSDHTTGASGVMEVLAYRLEAEQEKDRCYTVYKHIDYSIVDKPANLEGTALQNKSGSFAVLTATQRHFLDFHNWDAAHLTYIPRNYYTTVTLPDGCDTPSN